MALAYELLLQRDCEIDSILFNPFHVNVKTADIPYFVSNQRIEFPSTIVKKRLLWWSYYKKRSKPVIRRQVKLSSLRRNIESTTKQSLDISPADNDWQYDCYPDFDLNVSDEPGTGEIDLHHHLDDKCQLMIGTAHCDRYQDFNIDNSRLKVDFDKFKQDNEVQPLTPQTVESETTCSSPLTTLSSHYAPPSTISFSLPSILNLSSL